MTVPRVRTGTDRLWRGPRPSDYALRQAFLGYAIALHGGGVVTAVIAAAIDDGAGVSRDWQLATLSGLVLWSVFFMVSAYRYGPRLPLMACNATVVALLLLAQPRLVPVSAVLDETTWAIMLAGTTVYVTVLVTGQTTGLLLSAMITAAYLLGAPAETSQIRALIVQVLAVSAIMGLLRHGGRRADAIVADRDRERWRALVEAARRADEREHRAQMHDSVLATLTMVASGAVPADSPALRKDARRALEVVEMFSGDPPSDDAPVDLVSQLRDLVTEFSGTEHIEFSAPQHIDVPHKVAAAFTGAVAEALRNVARHSGASQATVCTQPHGTTLTVTVTDRGCGFDTDNIPATRHGIRHSIIERMTQIGGHATVTSNPGKGTEILLRWRRD